MTFVIAHTKTYSSSRILVVEDDAAVRSICVRTVSAMGFAAHSADNGQSGLQLLRQQHFDLVLTDIRMPHMDGIDLLRTMRTFNVDTDVIMLTGHGSFETAREAMRLGAFDYLTKPICISDLERAIRRTLEWRRVRAEKQHLSEIIDLYEISQTFTQTLDTTTAVRDIVRLLWRRFAPATLSLTLLHPDDRELELLAAQGFTDAPRIGSRIAVDANTESSICAGHQVFCGRCDLDQSKVVSPMLRTNDRPVGLLQLTRNDDQPGFGNDDRTMLAICASQIAASLDNSRLYQQLKEQNLQTVQALTAAIDARDPYTMGHSEQVMRYAVRLGEVLGLQPQRIEAIRYGALLHDIGKIGIRDYILLKPGPLTEEEMAVMRLHPKIGADIMRSIKALRDIVPMIECHHERIGGTGYPKGISGVDLGEEARILAIADAYDAMTSHRSYRRAMHSEEAFAQLRLGRGTHWDARFVGVFIELIQAEGQKLSLPSSRPEQLAVSGMLGRPLPHHEG